MKTYRITFNMNGEGTLQILAPTLEEAIRIAKDQMSYYATDTRDVKIIAAVEE
jgi:hypothetical protein